ncbi:SpaH/EbpB family LPXTG-anchored major pilin [Lactobacillus sp. LC28-10]|uniref:SpaH/EbpB family LPXTG-anchored major pilin n=1 Tax=Secundilactobacillus angelensis TaxID=2722706 RepID=A0ABX1KVM9_9LACO|nr:SpaH/EbpB family LPXTG-anchored major pilin [Secundilactobacillus angelensis]MCH5461686.1 SpaH/EbpB family LPXTG-anchored major pilin [Secundilactobacillus angelensis]NLR17982.1 SpaH/EbpB family LPXTG-anchored major pilin [Secundilactobacillus angelensis]
MNKFKHIFTALLLVLPLVLAGFTGASAKAAESSNDTAYIRLHKLAFESDKDLPSLPGSDDLLGQELTGDQLQGGKPLNGVEFTAYDVTKGYGELKGSSTERQTIIRDNAAQYATDGAVVGDPQTTKGEGTADFALPVKSTIETGKYAVYLIRETKSTTAELNGNQSVVKAADPIVLIMPLNKTSTKDDPLHIYPKNQTKKAIVKDLADLDKLDLVTDKNDSSVKDAILGYGDETTYTVSVVVPTDVTSLDQFVLTDTPDPGLNINTGSLLVSDDSGQNVPGWTMKPQLSQTGDSMGFKLSFDKAQLAPFAGKTITLTYKATVNKKLIPGAILNNHITLNGQDPVKANTPITTGGAKFEKTASDTGDGLKGAQFLVTSKGDNKYLVDTGKGYEWVDLPTGFDAANYNPDDLDKGAVVLTSGDDGNFSVEGLTFGEYALTEVKAPEGYALLTEPQAFTVNAASYDDENRVKIENAVEGVLPHTGGMGIYLIILIGVVIIIAGLLLFKRNKRHEEI